MIAGGPFRIVVSGGVASMPTLKVWVTGGCSTLPARSTARTRNVWLPTVRSEYSIGASHCSNGSASKAHWNSMTGSLAVKLKIASKTPSMLVTWAVLIVVTGRVVSRMAVQVQLAGLVSTCWATLTARTRRMCGPGSTFSKWDGSGQLVKAAPSSAHWKVASGSLLSKAKIATDSPVSGS